MQTYTINSETHPPAKDMDHHYYQGKDIIHSVESCGMADGPGLRYILFLQGYLMRRLYCHNWNIWDLHTDKCQEMTVKQVMKQVMSRRHYLEAANDGATAAGSEPPLQYEFARDWFAVCREHGIRTCLGTNDYALYYSSVLEDLSDHINPIILDLKQIDPEIHKVLVGIPNAKTLNFARHLAKRGQSIHVCYVIVFGYIDDGCSMRLLGGFTDDMENVSTAKLPPCHELGVHKWALCGDEYKPKGVHPLPKEAVLKIKEVLEGYGESVIY